jgi:hypothetical protein
MEETPVAFTVPPLPYPFDALEPHIDAKTMEIHHDKHHAAYVTNLNKALEGHPDLQSKSLEDLLKGLDSLPEAIRNPVRNNAGGHWNHSLFWTQMKKGGRGEPKVELADAISGFRFVRGVPDKIRCGRRGALRLRLGLAAGERREAGDRLYTQPGHTDLAEGESGAWPGCLGARLLPEVSEQEAGLHRRLVERSELGFSGGALRSGQEVRQAK